jgi:hypothetical protein
VVAGVQHIACYVCLGFHFGVPAFLYLWDAVERGEGPELEVARSTTGLATLLETLVLYESTAIFYAIICALNSAVLHCCSMPCRCSAILAIPPSLAVAFPRSALLHNAASPAWKNRPAAREKES